MFLLRNEYILSIIDDAIYVFIKGGVYFIDDAIYVFIKGGVVFIDNQWCNLCFYR